MTKGSVRLGREQVDFTVAHSSRRTLAITVTPDGDVSVTAPTGTSPAAIEARLIKRGGWILRTRREFLRLRPRTPERRYVNGETHRFLGRQYLLEVVPDAPRGVALRHDRIVISGIPAEETTQLRNRLALWYQREARHVLGERFTRCWTLFGTGRKLPRLVITPMSKRWGSLSSTGATMTLNARLSEADVDTIDFVILHEICHLDHHDHGFEFHKLLTARMPDWRTRKARLERWML